MSELVDSQVIKYTRLACLPCEPPSLAAGPTLDVSKFQHSKPLPDEGRCPLKQEFLNKWETFDAVQSDLKALVSSWNKARNPAGGPWKGAKRMLA